MLCYNGYLYFYIILSGITRQQAYVSITDCNIGCPQDFDLLWGLSGGYLQFEPEAHLTDLFRIYNVCVVLTFHCVE